MRYKGQITIASYKDDVVLFESFFDDGKSYSPTKQSDV